METPFLPLAIRCPRGDLEKNSEEIEKLPFRQTMACEAGSTRQGCPWVQ
jgi:hypothetical protein